MLYLSACATPTCQQDTTRLSHGSVCGRDQFDRPIAVSVNICPIFVGGVQAEERWNPTLGSLLQTGLGVMGLDAESIAFWWDHATGEPRTPRGPPRQGDALSGEPALGIIPGSSLAGFSFHRPSNQTMQWTGGRYENQTMQWTGGRYELQTPAATQVARKHFNCHSLAGVALESGKFRGRDLCLDGGLYGTEVLAGCARRPSMAPVLSNLSLALLFDTGWYHVDSSRAGCLQRGRNDSLLPYMDT